MERLNRNVGASQRSLEERPEIFDSLRMNLPFDVSLGMIHDIMHETIMQRVVSNPFIRVHLRPMLHRVKNFFLQRLALHVRNNFGSDLPNVTVEHSDDDGLSLGSALDVVADPLFVVHVLEVPANEGFVNLDWPRVPADFCERAILQGQPKPLKNEPCGLLCNPQVPS